MDWDDRFHILPTKDNQRVHRRFKEFFDKPSASIERMSPRSRKLDYIPAPSLKASLEVHPAREVKVWNKAARRAEKKWDYWFATPPSFTNELQYPLRRTLFISAEKIREQSPEEKVDSFYTSLQKKLASPRKQPRSLVNTLRSYHRSPVIKLKERGWQPKMQPPSFLNECSHQFRRSYFA